MLLNERFGKTGNALFSGYPGHQKGIMDYPVPGIQTTAPGGAGWNNPHAGQPAVYLKAVRLHWYLPITAMPWLALKKTRKFRWLFLLLLW
jgi:hypothetical protein